MKFSKILDILSPSVPEIVARRKSWSNKDHYIKSMISDDLPVLCDSNSKITSYWWPTHQDLFADDWEIIRLKK